MTTNNRNVKSSKSETIKCTSSLQNKKVRAEKTRIKAIAVDKKSCEKALEYYCVEWLAVTKNRIKDSTYVKYFNILILSTIIFCRLWVRCDPKKSMS